MFALILVGIDVAVLELTLWMGWGPRIILPSPILSQDKSKSPHPDYLGLREPLSSFGQHLYIVKQVPTSVIV